MFSLHSIFMNYTIIDPSHVYKLDDDNNKAEVYDIKDIEELKKELHKKEGPLEKKVNECLIILEGK